MIVAMKEQQELPEMIVKRHKKGKNKNENIEI